MSNDVHPAVRLLVKRANSHPEEFERGNAARWGWEVNKVLECGSEADKAALNAALQPIWMDEVHKAVMSRLLSGSNPGNFKTILEEWEQTNE